MSKREPFILLQDIEEAIGKIERYTNGMSLDDFMDDEKTIDAVVRNLEIIGEAARQMPEGFKSKHESIPWHQISGLRNRIVHEYFGIDLEIIWQVVAKDLSKLKKALPNIRQQT